MFKECLGVLQTIMNVFVQKIPAVWLLLTATGLLAQNNTLDFDGVDDRVDCGTDSSIAITGKKLTLEAWIYPTAWKKAVYEGNVINKEYNTSNYGFMLRVGDGGKLNFAFGNGSWHELTSSTAVLSLNTWQHIAGTYDGAYMRIYVNGSIVDSLAETGSIMNDTATRLMLGAHLGYSRFYAGMMDEVRIWNVCRSAAELNAMMGREFCSKPVNLKAYYKFNQGKAAQSNTGVKKLNDLSRYRNHGTLSSFTLNGSGSNWLSGQKFSKDAVFVNDTVSACARYTSPSRRFSWIKSGVYNDTIPTVVMGCDSIITTHLTIRKVSSSQFKAYACSAYVSPSKNYTWTKSGVYTDYLKNYQNCDSILTITLTVGGSTDSIYPVVCNSYRSPSGKLLSSSGTYWDTLTNFRNCDSVISIFLKVKKSSYASLNLKACAAAASPSGKYLYTQTGVYTDTIPNKTGCDSIITVQFKILRSSSSISRTVCGGMNSPSGKYRWTQSGVYRDTIGNYAFCDSVVTVNLIVYQASSSQIKTTVCRRFVAPVSGRVYSASGVYYDTARNYRGCDSIVAMDITVIHINKAVAQNGAVLSAQHIGTAYRWLDCNKSMSAVSGATAKVQMFQQNGAYAVEITDNGCMDTSACYTVSNLSVNGQETAPAILLYPNPFSGSFTLQALRPVSGVLVHITDAAGKVVYSHSCAALDTLELAFEGAPGFYTLHLTSAEGTMRSVLQKL